MEIFAIESDIKRLKPDRREEDEGGFSDSQMAQREEDVAGSEEVELSIASLRCLYLILPGENNRVSYSMLDVGLQASKGFFDRDVLAISFSPKDEHEAQVKFALERGIFAISNVMGTVRLPYPSRVFDIFHCVRCRVPWHIEGGKLLLELNRVLRPGGFFVWSATPVYQKKQEDVEIWEEKICWKIVTINKDPINEIDAAIYRKPTTNECYEQRLENDPPICEKSDEPNAESTTIGLLAQSSCGCIISKGDTQDNRDP